jgi:hypothetical protein
MFGRFKVLVLMRPFVTTTRTPLFIAVRKTQAASACYWCLSDGLRELNSLER